MNCKTQVYYFTEMDLEQKAWTDSKLAEKSALDQTLMDYVFMRNYTQLLDTTVRKNIKNLCPGCYDDDVHICSLQTANIMAEIGIDKLMELADKQDSLYAWQNFLKDIAKYFKCDILKWFHNFPGINAQMDRNKSKYCDYMHERYWNGSHHPLADICDDDDLNYW